MKTSWIIKRLRIKKRKGHAMSIEQNALKSPSFQTSKTMYALHGLLVGSQESLPTPGEPMISNYIQSPKLGSIA